MRYDNTTNDYRLKQTQKKIIPAKVMQEIAKRQQLSALIRAKNKIEEYQNDVFSIIDTHGLNSDEPKIQLETAIKVLPYIIPQKKAIETTVIHKTIEQIIKESTEEAQIIENKPESNNVSE